MAVVRCTSYAKALLIRSILTGFAVCWHSKLSRQRHVWFGFHCFAGTQGTSVDNQRCNMLPPEVWRLIAGHVSMREWAQVSGINKTTWQQHPPDL